MALAGLVGLGAVALWNDLSRPFWHHGPAYVAASTPLAPWKCRAWERRAEKGAALGLAASLEAMEGFSRLQGACHPQDQERGRAMIEAAIANGAGAFLMMEYVLALRRVGDKARADGELPIVAEMMYPSAESRWLPRPRIWRPLARDAWDEIVLMETSSSDWDALQSRLDHILGRTPMMRKTEAWVIWMLLARMRTGEYPEAAFQQHRAWRAGRYGVGERNNSLSVAANCGHPDAIRTFARGALSGEDPSNDARTAISHVIWLDSRTGAEAALLSELFVRFPSIRIDPPATIIERQNKSIAERCGPRVEKTLGRAG